MQKKILRAIYKGIYEGLLDFTISDDNEDEDFSIKKAKLSDETVYTYLDYMQLEFDDLIEQEKYDAAIKKYAETGIGLDKYITFIDDKNEEYPYERCFSKKLMFAKLHDIYTDDTENEIYISLKPNLSIFPAKWQVDKMPTLVSEDPFLMTPSNDYNGYANCLDLLNRSEYKKFIISSGKNLPAIRLAMNLKIKNNGVTYQGYIPALGLLLILYKYAKLLNYLLYLLNFDDVIFSYDGFWTSNEYSDTKAWILYKDYASVDDMHVITHSKESKHIDIMAFPFFKKMS